MPVWRPAIAAVCLLLAGCEDVVGTGSRPTDVVISYLGSTDGYQSFECSSFQLTATTRFEKGNEVEYHDVTGRSHWRSSNPGVIDVSNGDLESEPGSGLYLPRGVVVARTVGTGVIEVEYGGYTDSFAVSAEALPELHIEPELTALVPSSYQRFELKARLDSGEPDVDITDSAIWRLRTAGAPADVVEPSTVVALSGPVGAAFTLEAALPVCDRVATRTLSLGQVQSLSLHYEQPENVAIPIGLGDRLRVEAIFDDPAAAPQNLSNQLSIERLAGRDRDSALVAGVEDLFLSGAADGELAQFELRYEPLSMALSTRPALFSDVEIMSLRISPADPELLYPQELQLEGFGIYEDGIERPVRRIAAWSSRAPEIAGVVATGADGGLVTPAGPQGTARIEARAQNRFGELLDRVDLRVRRP
jgi:hypothetical protein